MQESPKSQTTADDSPTNNQQKQFKACQQFEESKDAIKESPKTLKDRLRANLKGMQRQKKLPQYFGIPLYTFSRASFLKNQVNLLGSLKLDMVKQFRGGQWGGVGRSAPGKSNSSSPQQLKFSKDQKGIVHRKSLNITLQTIQKLLPKEQQSDFKNKAENSISDQSIDQEKDDDIISLNQDVSLFQKAETFDKTYDVGKILGQGSTAVVKHCTKKQTGQEFAVKIVRTSDEQMVKAIQAQFHILSNLPDHQNILKVYELYQDGEKATVYMVMELIEGKELADIIQEKQSFTELETRDIFQQILKAIQHLHMNGVVHRDLTPFNIMLQQGLLDTYTVKLMDFNVSKRVKSSNTTQITMQQSQSSQGDSPLLPKKSPFSDQNNLFFNPYQNFNYTLHTQTGTPTFNAPQMIRGDFYYSQVVDQWSAGCILYMMISGAQPFYSENVAQLQKQIQLGQYDLNEANWRKCSIQIKDLLQRLLSIKANKRMTAFEALKCPWFDNSIVRGQSMPVGYTRGSLFASQSTDIFQILKQQEKL